MTSSGISVSILENGELVFYYRTILPGLVIVSFGASTASERELTPFARLCAPQALGLRLAWMHARFHSEERFDCAYSSAVSSSPSLVSLAAPVALPEANESD